MKDEFEAFIKNKLEEGVEFDGKKSSPCKAVLNKYGKITNFLLF